MSAKLTRVRFEATGDTKEDVEQLLIAHSHDIQLGSAATTQWKEEEMEIQTTKAGWWGRYVIRREEDLDPE